MDSAERSKLVEKKQKEVDDFISQLKPKKYEDGWPEDRWEQEMEKHPIFMTKPVEEGQELPPLVEALQQLKYDPDVNSPEELAKSYKEDGNQNFKSKKYRWAVESYTKGLEAKSEDNELNAQLYTNRAAAHYYIGNYQKSLRDAEKARSIKPNHLKAFQRGAMCCWELREFEDCISWCVEGLKLDAEDKTLLDLKRKAGEKKKVARRDLKKNFAQELRRKKEREALKKAIKERGICIEEKYLDLAKLKPMHPALPNAELYLDENDRLVWPVMFIYPEYETTDCIQHYHEDTCFYSHFEVMFNDDNYPSWDKNRSYIADNLQVYFSDISNNLVQLDQLQSLSSALSHKRYKVRNGIPSFIITVANSEFDKSYRIKNGLSV